MLVGVADQFDGSAGGANPLGLERYARVVGRPEILLLPAFVADAWEPLAAAR